MSQAPPAGQPIWSPHGSFLAAVFRWPPRHFWWARPVMVGFRTAHIVAMALVLGGLAFDVAPERLRVAALLAVMSGLAMLGVEVMRSAVYLYQGAGLLVMLKVALLGLGQLDPAWLVGCYLAAAVVASVGSHMTAPWRHYSIVDGRVLDQRSGR